MEKRGFPMSGSRRDVLRFGAVASLPFVGLGSLVLTGCTKKSASPEFLRMLCDIVIPKTATGGAVEAGVPTFLPRAFASGLFGGDSETLAQFEVILDGLVMGSGFVNAKVADRLAIITEIDTSTFAKRGPPSPDGPAHQRLWRTIKGGIVQSYYTSEIGGSQELTFELIPGDTYRSDVAVGDVPYLSNYWMENVF